MNTTIHISDPGLIAKVIHLGIRHGCTYTKLHVHRSNDDRYEATFDFEGPDDGLRRLHTQIEKIAFEDTSLHNDTYNSTKEFL